MRPIMCNQPNKKTKNHQGEEENNPLIKCGHLILPWLTSQELANTSLTCKSLSKLSALVILSRSLDSSRCFENLPIPFYNPINNHPPYYYFLYTPSQILPSDSPSRQYWGDPHGGSLQHRKTPTGSQPASSFSDSLVLEEGVGVLVENEEGCGVGRGGIRVMLRVVWDERKGWCLVADQDIRRFEFVCEYAGEVLTTKEARSRQLIYDELSSAGQFSSALLVVREHLPSGKACFRINIDATRIGNVARFINHSCDGGNLLSILVRTPGVLMPRLCFFASQDIKKGEELTFSYGETRVRSNGLKCFCGSSCCHGTLPSEET